MRFSSSTGVASRANCARGGLAEFPVAHSERETPLPIPNRAVKPFSADGTWGATPWESRSPPVLFSPPAPGWRAGCASRPTAPDGADGGFGCFFSSQGALSRTSGLRPGHSAPVGARTRSSPTFPVPRWTLLAAMATKSVRRCPRNRRLGGAGAWRCKSLGPIARETAAASTRCKDYGRYSDRNRCIAPPAAIRLAL